MTKNVIFVFHVLGLWGAFCAPHKVLGSFCHWCHPAGCARWHFDRFGHFGDFVKITKITIFVILGRVKSDIVFKMS